jgi:serine/threonine protein kinase
MGEVYRARDTKLGRDVALKIMPGNLCRESRVKENRDAEALPKLPIARQIGSADGVLQTEHQFAYKSRIMGLRFVLDPRQW